MSVAEALRVGSARLAPDDCARLDTELLLADASGLSRAQFYSEPERELALEAAARFEQLLADRARGIPTAYLLRRAAFWTLELRVDDRVLVPRPETELLVEMALARTAVDSNARIADLGTGSGAIALAIASERPRVQIIAIDVAADALKLAAVNGRVLELGNVTFVRGDWTAALADHGLDLVISNPPYVATTEASSLGRELAHEPPGALFSGRDGLNAIRGIVGDAQRVLVAGGSLLIEHGAGQGEAVRRLFERAGFIEVTTERDLNGLERVTAGRHRG